MESEPPIYKSSQYSFYPDIHSSEGCQFRKTQITMEISFLTREMNEKSEQLKDVYERTISVLEGHISLFRKEMQDKLQKLKSAYVGTIVGLEEHLSVLDQFTLAISQGIEFTQTNSAFTSSIFKLQNISSSEMNSPLEKPIPLEIPFERSSPLEIPFKRSTGLESPSKRSRIGSPFEISSPLARPSPVELPFELFSPIELSIPLERPGTVAGFTGYPAHHAYNGTSSSNGGALSNDDALSNNSTIVSNAFATSNDLTPISNLSSINNHMLGKDIQWTFGSRKVRKNRVVCGRNAPKMKRTHPREARLKLWHEAMDLWLQDCRKRGFYCQEYVPNGIPLKSLYNSFSLDSKTQVPFHSFYKRLDHMNVVESRFVTDSKSYVKLIPLNVLFISKDK